MSIPITLQSMLELLLENQPHHLIQKDLGLQNQTYLNYKSGLIKVLLDELGLQSKEHAVAVLYDRTFNTPNPTSSSVMSEAHEAALAQFLAKTDATHREIAAVNAELNKRTTQAAGA